VRGVAKRSASPSAFAIIPCRLTGDTRRTRSATGEARSPHRIGQAIGRFQ
jgi:hypothetical protein